MHGGAREDKQEEENPTHEEPAAGRTSPGTGSQNQLVCLGPDECTIHSCGLQDSAFIVIIFSHLFIHPT